MQNHHLLINSRFINEKEAKQKSSKMCVLTFLPWCDLAADIDVDTNSEITVGGGVTVAVDVDADAKLHVDPLGLN